MNPDDVTDYQDGFAFGSEDGYIGAASPDLSGASPEWRRGYLDGYDYGDDQAEGEHSGG